MSEDENNSQKENRETLVEMDIDELKKLISKNAEIIELLNHPTRYRLIFLLLIFPRLSLADLSKFIGRTKSTIHYHLKKFEKLNIFRTTRKAVQSYIDAKIYELMPDFLNILKFTIDDFQKYSKENREDIIRSMILKDISVFELFRSLFEQTTVLYRAMENAVGDNKQESSKELIEMYTNNPVKYDIWSLSEEEFEMYESLIEQFKEKLNNKIKGQGAERTEIERPFFILHTIFPMKQMIKYDSETKKYLKFYKALE
jgi:formate dehydrogenase maturation protein FdhE